MLGPLLQNPNLWHFNRRSVSTGMFAGILAAFIPLPLQMVLAGLLSVCMRGNLPVALGATWISNPLTYGPLYYMCYLAGSYLLGHQVMAESSPVSFDLNSITTQAMSLGKPLLLGCSVLGLTTATLCYALTRLLWRLHVYKAIRLRRTRNQTSHKR